MIHSPHRLKIYLHQRHRVSAAIILLLPAVFLLIAAALGKIYAPAIANALALTFFRVLAGYAISLFVGVSLAVLVGGNKMGEALLPLFDILQNLPSFALIPLFASALGYTDIMAIVFAATSIIWPILFYTLHAIQNARQDLNDAAEVFGALGLKRIIHYLLPLSTPAVITGSLVGISIGWEAVIGIELIGLHSGIGLLLSTAEANNNHAVMTAGIAAILLLVFALNRLIWIPLLKKTQHYAE